MDKKNWIIIFLVICCGILGWLLYNKPVLINDGGIIQARMDSIAQESKRRDIAIHDRDIKIEYLKKQNDSLGVLEIKTINNSSKKYEKMDKLNANQLCDQFDSVFADTNIK